jgi:hypothetical protein
MDGADEGRGAVGGIGCRLNGDGAATIWHNGQADLEVAPFKLPCIPLDEEDSLVMQGVIEKNLNERIWKELSEEEAGKCLYVSRELFAYNADSKPRSVAYLSHLPDHYDPIVTKSETLEGFSVSLLPDDHLLSMDLRSGFHHFRLHPDMRKFFTVRVKCRVADTGIFSILCYPSGGAGRATGSRVSFSAS